jgi:phosphoribosylformylglycinamidine synthase
VKLISVKQLQSNLKKSKLKFSVTVTLKKDVLDPQGKVVQNTLQNLGMDNLKSVRQGKYFELELNDNDQAQAEKKVDDMCKKLLANLIIEDYKINKI